MVVLPSTTAPASRMRAAGGASALAGVRSVAAVPSGTGTPRVAMFSLMVAGTPSSVAAGRQRLALQPARLGFAGGGQRAFGIQRVGGFQAGFPALDVRQHGAGGFDGDRVLAR